MFKKHFLILLILLLAVFLRFWNLGGNPPSLTWDETAWGYNAYSLGIDGKDEYGRFLPYDYLESFGDFKPPVYAYLALLPVKLFGLNEFAVRFPSAFFGVLTVLATYFLVREIFRRWEVSNEKLDKEVGSEKKSSHFSLQNQASHIALLTSFILAISPWHINLSRAAFEANVATFFIVAGVLLFLRGVGEKKWHLPFAAISFVLSMYTFNTARVIAPILVLILIIGFVKQLLQRKKIVIISIFVGALLLLPTLKFLLSPQASLRFKEVNIFSDIGIIERTNQEIANDHSAWWSKILHNRRFAYGVEYFKHYFDNLNPSFLFIKGDGNPKFSTQTVGEMYLWDLPFFIVGILLLFRKKEGKRWIIPLWLIIGIIPAATARETPHALRIEAALPTFQIFTAYGVYVFVNSISKINPFGKLRVNAERSRSIKYQIANINIKYLIFTVCFLFLIFNVLYYLHGYYMHYPREYSGEWQYGYKGAIEYIKSNEEKYEKIYFTESLGRPYIYVLFYTQYDPKKFRQEAIVEREVAGFVHVKGFEKYRFARDIKSNAGSSEKVLYVDTPANVPENAQILKNFYLLNGQKTLAAYIL